ncbi:MAG TPA: hypothetical protein VOA87_08590 [Thermoanaerobaculia bacterium]|nr:hypothetical protein [Thermoanaerobaculia bacterium]
MAGGPLALYAVFALLSVAGTYLALASQRGRAAGVWGAVGALLFFAALYWGLVALFRQAPPGLP